jgi:hypothetical protein
LKEDETADSIQFNFDSPKKLAELVQKMLIWVEMDADILLRRYKIRPMALQKAKAEGGTQVQKLLASRDLQKDVPAIYTRDRIMADLAINPDTLAVLTSFLTA